MALREGDASPKPVTPSGQSVGGSVETHLSARPLRYRFDQAGDDATRKICCCKETIEPTNKVSALANLFGSRRRSGPGSLWPRVETGMFSMRQMWQSPAGGVPVHVRAANRNATKR